VIPVALGMLWLPWIRRVPAAWLRGLMALTVGLLAFLAVDATLEGFELAGQGTQAFGGATLVFVGALTAYLALSGVSSWLGRRAAAGSATLVAVGIGLHNLGLNDDVVRGMAELTGNERFAFDSYRRLINMFGDTVMGVDHEHFEHELSAVRSSRGVQLDTDLGTNDLREVVER
jgi:hypothetical protein